MVDLGILSDCRCAMDLERYANRHHKAFGAGMDQELPKESLKTYIVSLFKRVELEEYW
jgi:hypothetical protein